MNLVQYPGRVYFNCPTCGTKFWRYRSQTEATVSYCSLTCRPKRLLQRTCEACGKAFEEYESRAKRGGARFCSFDCARPSFGRLGDQNYFWRGGVLQGTCERCGKAITLSQYGGGRRKRFCSHSCWAKSRTGAASPSWSGGGSTRICRWCEQGFRVGRSVAEQGRGRYCSQRCMAKAYSQVFGPDHPNWKNRTHLKTERQTAMARQPYRDWRTGVFARDSYTCRVCSAKGARLNAHHIKSWNEFPDLRYDLDNGITLCIDCHRAVHRGDVAL